MLDSTQLSHGICLLFYRKNLIHFGGKRKNLIARLPRAKRANKLDKSKWCICKFNKPFPHGLNQMLPHCNLLSEGFHLRFRQTVSSRIHGSSQRSPSTHKKECVSPEHALSINPLNYPTSFLALLSRCFGVYRCDLWICEAIWATLESTIITCRCLTELRRVESKSQQNKDCG